MSNNSNYPSRTHYNSRNHPAVPRRFGLFEDFFDDAWNWPAARSTNHFRIDVRETENEYFVEAEMPGVNREEISVDFNDGHLTISVNKNEDKENKSTNYLHRERHWTGMQRTIHLSEAGDEGVKAKLQDGMLKVEVPKSKKSKPNHRVNID
ncbi:MAG: Hsp20/alpha crystallin family protein [Eubacteriaceae bacterium]|nr:Hsp20/alpha crystallin family protein [Eubacteriaceae bacterium]